jgi:hypothetical protein
MDIILSLLPHTWLIDVDGTLVRHNGHKIGDDELLPGVREFWSRIPTDDTIVLMSARTEEEQVPTLEMLRRHGLRFDRVLFGLPVGERVLINDRKPGGLRTALAVNPARDIGLTQLNVILDNRL